MKIEDLQNNPQVCLNHIKAGESMLLLENGKPVAEIKPLPIPRGAFRPYGLCAGQLAVPDDFDAPLPDDVLREFRCLMKILLDTRVFLWYLNADARLPLTAPTWFVFSFCGFE